MQNVGYLTISLDLAGQGFDPNMLIGNFAEVCVIRQPLNELKRYGHGRGKQISERGHCCFEMGENIPYEHRIEKFVKLYEEIKKVNTRDKLNIDWFYVSMLFTGSQGNMELTQTQLLELSKVEEGIAINYIFASDSDYRKQKRLKRLKRHL
jgi:hypothetical protein